MRWRTATVRIGPLLRTYRTGVATIATTIHFAHGSRRLMILTVSQIVAAAKTTPKIDRAVLMPDEYTSRDAGEGMAACD
jgi:hypothetical protein